METRKYILANLKDGVATTNADPFNIGDNLDYVRQIIEEAGEILEHTPEDTDVYEWEVMCSQLDLAEGRIVSRIYEARDFDARVMLFADENDYD